MEKEGHERNIKYMPKVFTVAPWSSVDSVFSYLLTPAAFSKTIAKLSSAVQLIKSVGFKRKKIINNLSPDSLAARHSF